MDIVVTIPKSEYRNDDIETEAFLNNEDAYQFWTLNKVPKSLDIGDKVYFIKNGLVESSMRVFDIQRDVEQKCDITDRIWKGACILYLDDLKYLDEAIISKGFQGFRYRWW